MKRVLIACEYSGIMRKAFAEKGFDTWSCDLLDTEMPTELSPDEIGNGYGNHVQGNVLELLNEHWDLLIGFPPCTYLSYAGMNNWYDEGRAMKRIEAAKFFMQLWQAPIKNICIENPRGIMNKIFRQPDQVIHPYYFGEAHLKRTCLWLKNLPKLVWLNQSDLFGTQTAIDKPEPVQVQICKKTGRLKNRYFTDSIVGRIKSGHEKSKSFSSIAQAMSNQWSHVI
jgi:hypothetical protein